MPTFRCIHPLSGVLGPGLHVAHRHTSASGANFVVNRHKTHVNTLKSKYSHSLIFGRDTWVKKI